MSIKYEHKRKPLASKNAFYKRVFYNLLIALVFLIFSLYLGVAGYHYICGLNWVDSLLNASMILGGMGPVDPIDSDSGKIFASVYALYSGISFLGSFAFILAPVFHRFMHRFHLDDPSQLEE